MITNFYAMFDVKSDVFDRPFLMSTNGQALRAFSDFANDKSTLVGRHPEDFKLVKIGIFDDATGNITPVPFESLGFASDYVNKG